MQILAKIQTNRFTISWTVPPSKLWHLWTKDHPTSSPLYDSVAGRQLHIDTNHPHHGASVLASPKHIYEISTKVTKKFMHFLSCSIFIQYKSIYFNYETLFLKFHTQIFHADCTAISDSGLGSEISSNTTKVACVDVHLPTLIPTNHEAKKTRPKSIAVKNRLICVLFYFVDLLISLWSIWNYFWYVCFSVEVDHTSGLHYYVQKYYHSQQVKLIK